VKKRVDTLLTKTIEFKSKYGRKIKISEIPVLEEDSPLYFNVNTHLQLFLSQVVKSKENKTNYCFRDYLKRTLKWKEFEKIYFPKELKSNA
jgi:uncharacterized protein Veg